MRKRKILPTRRREAFRHIARALVLLLVVNYLLGLGHILPIQAIRETEEREGVYHTRVLRRMWVPEIYKTSMFYLTANENALLLGDTHFTYLGWVPGFGTALDCSGDAPLHVAERCMSRGDSHGLHYFFYGRVDDPAIETVEISLRYTGSYDGMKGEFISQEHERLTAPIWQERDGHRYFLNHYYLENWPEASPLESGQHASITVFVIGKNAAGEVLTEFDIQKGSHASYG